MVVGKIVRLTLLLISCLVENVFAVNSISIVTPQNFPLNLNSVRELCNEMKVDVVVVNEDKYQFAPLSNEDKKDHLVFSLGDSIDGTDYHISFRQDPQSVLPFLKNNLSAISKIHLIARHSDSAYASRATLVAESIGLEVKIHPAPDDKINEVYLKAFDSVDPASELLWVTHKIDEKVRFYMLEKSWKSKVVLIANYTSYVKQGMLIGFGIEFETLEKEIANIIISILKSKSKVVDKRIYLNNLLTGLNKISAKRSLHLKSRQKWTAFDKRF